MKRILNVYALPSFVEPDDLPGAAAVVIDVLRATTTITHALEAGAAEVIPCLEVDDALALAGQFAEEDCILGGERNGVAIDGFQLGNSPEEYTPDRVGGKTVIFTTTNGTRAMARVRRADEVYLAAFVNVSAVAARLMHCDRIHIVCAGTDGRVGEDDVLLAGLLVDRLQRRGGIPYELNAQATTAREFWLHAFALPQAIGAEPLEPERLAEALRKSQGAKNLIALQLDDDILAASQIDCFNVAPQLDPQTFRIRAVRPANEG